MCMKAMDNLFVAVILLTAHVTLGHSSEDCIPKQILRPGESGTIRCTVRDGYFGVYWYDTQDLTHQPVLFSEDGQIGGRGYTSGEFNLASDGSLLIVQVAAKHERIFTVVIFENRDSDKLIQHTIEVFVIALPSLPYPDIKQCESKQYCYNKIYAGDELECAVHDARPPVHLTWVRRTMNHDTDVTFQRTYSSNADLNTTTATMRLRSSLHFHFHLFVCRAKYNTLVLDNLESFIITELDEPSTDLNNATDKEIEKDDSIILQCSRDKILFFIWKKAVPGTANVVIAHGYVSAGTTFSEQPYSIDRYGSLFLPQFNESKEGVYICYTSDGNKDSATSYNLTIASPVTQLIDPTGKGITEAEVEAKQRNTFLIVLLICIPVLGILILWLVSRRKKKTKNRREKEQSTPSENKPLKEKNMKEECQKSEQSEESPTTSDIITSIRSYEVGERSTGCRQVKVILLIGGRRSHQTELVSNLVIYFSGIPFTDHRRCESNIGQHVVNCISIYTPPSRFNFDIKIIDLPNDSDCSETLQPTAYEKTLEEMYQTNNTKYQLTQIDAIVIVNKFSRNNYVPYAALRIFGNDLLDNIYVFAASGSSDKFSKLAEKAANQFLLTHEHLLLRQFDDKTNNIKKDGLVKERCNLDSFYKCLTKRCSVSVERSKEVLHQRKELGREKSYIIDTYDDLQKHKSQLQKHIIAYKEKKVQLVNIAMICHACKNVCHEPCEHIVMTDCVCWNWFSYLRGCAKCPNSCGRDRHERCSYRYKTVQEKDTEKSNLDAAELKVKNTKLNIKKYAKKIERCLEEINQSVIYHTQISLDGDLTEKGINEIIKEKRKWDHFIEKINEIIECK